MFYPVVLISTVQSSTLPTISLHANTFFPPAWSFFMTLSYFETSERREQRLPCCSDFPLFTPVLFEALRWDWAPFSGKKTLNSFKVGFIYFSSYHFGSVISLVCFVCLSSVGCPCSAPLWWLASRQSHLIARYVWKIFWLSTVLLL